jgi:hypothetical protein
LANDDPPHQSLLSAAPLGNCLVPL